MQCFYNTIIGNVTDTDTETVASTGAKAFGRHDPPGAARVQPVELQALDLPAAAPVHAQAPGALAQGTRGGECGQGGQNEQNRQAQDWQPALASHLQALLAAGHAAPWNTTLQQVETLLLQTALQASGGRRMEAAQRLGIGRNTVTRKLQELGLGVDAGSGQDTAGHAPQADPGV